MCEYLEKINSCLCMHHPYTRLKFEKDKSRHKLKLEKNIYVE